MEQKITGGPIWNKEHNWGTKIRLWPISNKEVFTFYHSFKILSSQSEHVWEMGIKLSSCMLKYAKQHTYNISYS